MIPVWVPAPTREFVPPQCQFRTRLPRITRHARVWRSAATSVTTGIGKMLLFKSCPKCKGDVELNSDMDGNYAKCLMCGFSRYLPVASRRRETLDQHQDLQKAS